MRQIDYAKDPTYVLKRRLEDNCGSCAKYGYSHSCPRLRALQQGLLITGPSEIDEPCDAFVLGYNREKIQQVLTVRALSKIYV